MTHKALIISLLTFSNIFFSCQTEQKTLPIAQEKMELILTDVHLAEIAMQYVADEKRDSLEEIYYQQVFEIHQIDEALFIECMDFLANDPRLNSIIYKNMMDSLDARKMRATAKTPPKKGREWSQDSLSRE